MARMPAGSTGRRLLCVAPLVPVGGVDTLLTAFGMLAGDRPDLTLEVVGGGPLSRVLRTHADYLGVAERVRFCGPLAAPAVRRAVRGCAVLVLPHRDDGVAAGSSAEVALLEARAIACPVVATSRAAAQPTSLYAGLVVPPGAPTVLAQAVESALDAPVRADRCEAGTSPTTVLRSDRDGHLLTRAWHRVLR
jgi:glycosyltransferase involved in cell wall biosynthesis